MLTMSWAELGSPSHPSTVLFLKHWVSAGQAVGAQDSLPRTWLGEEVAFSKVRPRRRYGPTEKMTPSHCRWVLLMVAGSGLWLGQPVWVSQPGGLALGSPCVPGLGLCGERTPTFRASQRPRQDSDFSWPRNQHALTPEHARLPCNP